MQMTTLLAQTPWQFVSPLGPWQWAWLALVPLGIVLLYFLKLRRRAVQVPSTLLWKRSLEDLRVNSLFQRLRKNLLLWLQLIVVGLILLALAGPRIRGLTTQGQRYVLAIDDSASMSATDVQPTRLDAAKREARKIIDGMSGNDLAMIVAFNSSARVVANYTSDRALLARRLAEIQPTDAGTSLREALQLVAGLANPQKYFEPGEGVVASEVVAPRLYLFTDGGFADVSGFSLGNIQPELVPIGPPPRPVLARRPTVEDPEDSGTPGRLGTRLTEASDNIAILALSAARPEESPETIQLYGRVRNHREQPVSCQASLLRDEAGSERLIDAVALELPALGDQSFQFDLKLDASDQRFVVRLDVQDALALDNAAYLVIGQPRPARVLLVTPGNRFLADTLRTEAMTPLVNLTTASPEQLEQAETQRDLAAGVYDLVILDGAILSAPPAANVLAFGVLPPGLSDQRARHVTAPVPLDWDVAHPLLQYVRDFQAVSIRDALIAEPPEGARVLIESDQGPLAFAAGRGGYLDVFIGFTLIKGNEFNTNWPLRTGFPLFIYNCLHVLGSARDAGVESFRPDQPIPIRAQVAAEQVEVFDPRQNKIETITRSSVGTFVVNQARRVGIYEARWGIEPGQRIAFAVNLFDERESDLSTRGQVPPGVPDAEAERYRIQIGYTPVETTTLSAPAPLDIWWPLTLVALAVVLVEWYVYNRRVAL